MLTDYINHVVAIGFNTYGIVVIKDGIKVAEHHFVPEERRELYSITKSITATAVGMAMEEGHFSLNDSLLTFFDEDLPKDTPDSHRDALNKVTVERLLTMSIMDYPFGRLGCDHWLKYILSMPLPNIERRSFQYSNISAYLAGVIVERTTKEPMMDYLRPRLFLPLGIRDVECEYSPEGHYYGATGIKLTINELARFGQLYLQQGCFHGQRLLTKQWVESATSKQIETREGGYGYYFWRQQENSYRASGMNGQRCIIIPDKSAVIAVMSGIDGGSDELWQCVWDTVYSKL